MNADTFNALCVPLALPWKQALSVIDDTAQGVLLAVDAQRRLVRTVTDGDLRRAVLGEVPAHCTLAELPSAGDRPVVGPRAVPYDVLVLALGSGANDFGVPGVQAHCHFIDSQFQAEAFNHRLRWQLFRGALQDEAVTIDIVGAGT